MSDEVHTDHNYRSEYKSLLSGLKTVTEGLLSGQSSNVWNIHGGLNRMCAQLEKILYHGLKSTKGDLGIQLDFWPFVYSLKILTPVLAPALDKVNRSGGSKGSAWLRQSLQNHTLSSELSTLVSSTSLMNKFYYDFAFLNDKAYFKALLVCLKAIELNQISLLAELDLKLLSNNNEAEMKYPRSRSWAVPERKPCISTSERKSSSHDAMALAPPFASPQKESILCMSDEHAVPASINVQVPGEGNFRQPLQGQSLINYLSSQDFNTCANLDKENAHFSISEALIAAIEQMKWNHVISPKDRVDDAEEEEDSDEEINKLKQRIRIRKQQKLKEKAKFFPTSSDGITETATTSKSPSSELNSSFQDIDADTSDSDLEVDEISLSISDSDQENESNLNLIKTKGLSLSLASLYSDADLQKVKPDRQSSIEVSDQSLSAESVAILLLKKFSEKQLPKASELEWLVPISEAPQELLPLPKSYPVSPDDGESEVEGFANSVLGTLRLRGNNEWAPPRSQIIFDIHPYQKRSIVMTKQNFRCAGCGTRVEQAYMKRFRYCEYLGKYFCQCCHRNKINYIPGHIIRKWDFKQYPVSDFSWKLLSRIYKEPYFNLSTINPTLFKKVRILEIVHSLRLQLMYLWKFLRICKYSESLIREITTEPSHWHEDVDVYSISDLIDIKNTCMVTKLRDLVTKSIDHVEQCSFCQGFGFICELCGDERDIIFPFQLQKVAVCKECSTCFHKACYVEGKCPKCFRIEARKRQLQETKTLDSSEESDN